MKVTGELSVSQMQIVRKFSIWNFLGFSPPPFRFLRASFSYITATNSTLQHIDTLSVRLTSMLSLDKACSRQIPPIPCSSQYRLRSSQVVTHTIDLARTVWVTSSSCLQRPVLNKTLSTRQSSILTETVSLIKSATTTQRLYQSWPRSLRNVLPP